MENFQLFKISQFLNMLILVFLTKFHLNMLILVFWHYLNVLILSLCVEQKCSKLSLIGGNLLLKERELPGIWDWLITKLARKANFFLNARTIRKMLVIGCSLFFWPEGRPKKTLSIISPSWKQFQRLKSQSLFWSWKTQRYRSK